MILNDVSVTVDNLLALALEKQEAVIKCDVQSLQNLTFQEQELLMKLKSFEEQYINNDPCDESLVSDDTTDLKDKMSRLQQANQRNQVLLEKGLDLIRYELRLLLPAQGYDSNITNNSLLFDERT